MISTKADTMRKQKAQKFVIVQLLKEACHCEESAGGGRRSNPGFEIASLPSVARNDGETPSKLLQQFLLKKGKKILLTEEFI